MSTADQTLLRLAREQPFTRVVLWPGRSDGQSSHPSEALLGVYLTHRGGTELFYTKRVGADRLYSINPSEIVMVANATGCEVYWRHPTYKSIYSWDGSVVEPIKTADGKSFVYEVKATALMDGNLYTVTTFHQFNDASRFLKLVSQIDKP